MRSRALWILALAGAGCPAALAQFTPGNLVVARVGDGSAALSSAATAAFLEQYTVAGSLIGSPLALPTVGSGSNRRLTLAGSATSEGFLTLSSNSRFLMF